MVATNTGVDMPTPSRPVHSSEYISLKEHFDTRIVALEKATDMAAKNLDRRLDTMNEIRDQLKVQREEFITTPEHESLCQTVDRIREDVRNLQLDAATLAGKASQSSVLIGYALSAVGILLAVISLVKELIK